MTYKDIELSYEGNVATLALNRPSVLNALSRVMVAEMRDAIATVRRSEARALLLTGRGRAFCSGADLAGDTFVSGAKSAGFGDSVATALDESYNPLLRDLYALEIPLVSAVNGVTAGGGVGLALVADICIAARSASFVVGFGPRLGIVPDAGGSWLLARLLGRARALGMAMLGDRVSAEEAASWGLIWRAVDDAALAAEAGGVASRLANGPTRAFPSIRRVMDAAIDNTFSAHLDVERDRQRVLCDSADTAEGVAAFLEKRKPVFNGR
jgi:2-(1,2-epoxy-1,2-dihydrophenyl)acetyl-CoA isomerase